MRPDTLAINDSYVRYADLLLKHFRLLSNGKDESAGAEQIEDEMSRLWEKLDEAQRHSLNGIGSDLNWVRRRGELPPRGRRVEEVSSQDLDELKTAQSAKNWQAVLFHLRTCGSIIAPASLALIRERCYREIGPDSIADVFGEFAAELQIDAAGSKPKTGILT